jgi:hypothetical protein
MTTRLFKPAFGRATSYGAFFFLLALGSPALNAQDNPE